MTPDQIAEIERPVPSGPNALWTLNEQKDALLAEVKRLEGEWDRVNDMRIDESNRAHAAEAEVKRLREVEALWHRAGTIVERAIAKGYEIGGVELDDLAEALGIDVGEVSGE